MVQREILQLVEQIAGNLPEAVKLFSARCGRGNERRGTAETSASSPKPSDQAAPRPRAIGQADRSCVDKAVPFAGSRCERVTAVVLHRSACLSSGAFLLTGHPASSQHVSQASLRPRPKKGHTDESKCADRRASQPMHHCMTTRGVHKPGTDLVTSRMLGCFRDSALTRQEFLGMAV